MTKQQSPNNTQKTNKMTKQQSPNNTQKTNKMRNNSLQTTHKKKKNEKQQSTKMRVLTQISIWIICPGIWTISTNENVDIKFSAHDAFMQ
jgi:hypothetical protein